MNLREAIDDCLLTIKTVEHLSDETVRSYKHSLKEFANFMESLGTASIESISKNEIDQFITWYSGKDTAHPRSNSSVNLALAAVRKLFKITSQNHPEIYDTAAHLENRKTSQKIRTYVSEKDMRKILDSFGKSDREIYRKTLIITMYASGMRESELCDFLLNNAMLDAKQLKIIGKGNKERLVPVADVCVEYMRLYRDVIRPSWDKHRSRFFFINQYGRQCNPEYIKRLVKSKVKELGLDPRISPHSIRHGYATALLNNGTDLRYVQELLGHSSITTTQIYTHVNDEKLKRDYDKYFDVGAFLGDDEDDVK